MPSYRPERVDQGTIEGVLNTVESNFDSVMQVSMIAHWKMDEPYGERKDSYGTNHLTDNSSVAAVAGKLGNAALFNGTNWLDRPDNANLSMSPEESFSLSAWVYLLSETSGTILHKGDVNVSNGTEYRIRFAHSNNTFRFLVGNGTTESELSSVGGILVNTWYFLVCVHDAVANSLKIYVDSSNQSLTGYSGGSFDSASPLNIGRAYGGTAPTDYLNARVDSITLWKRALSSGNVVDLYNNGSGLDYLPSGEEFRRRVDEPSGPLRKSTDESCTLRKRDDERKLLS